MKRITQGINLNTILLGIVGFIGEETWRTIQNSRTDVEKITAVLPYIQQDIASLKTRCVDMDEVELAISRHSKSVLKTPHQE